MAARKPVLAVAGVPRVNLLPRAETDRRERAALTRTWAALSGAAVVVALVIIAGAFAYMFTSQQSLTQAQSSTADLTAKLAEYSKTSSALTQQRSLEAFRAAAVGNDLEWSAVLAEITAQMPAGASVTALSLTTGVPTGTGDAKSQVGLAGTFTALSAKPLDLPKIVRGLRAVEGVIEVDASTLTGNGGNAYTYSIVIAFDQSIYSGAYTAGSK